jgi:excinuclease ABC subunit C
LEAVFEVPFDVEQVPDRPAVFLVYPRAEAGAGSRPYLGRTTLLRRRLRRLLDPRGASSKRLNLASVAARVEVHWTANRLGAALTLYELARHHFPKDYQLHIKLRLPAYVKVLLTNPFPRTEVTTRLSASGSFHFGPFRTRAAAERFESEVLDLFQVRRCPEDLVPSPDHPGCIYGEMMKCLRPCQDAVTREEYASEASRLVHFLETGGASLLDSARAARDRFSQELDFEEAQRQHQRYQRIEQVLRLRDELAADASRLSGVAAAPSPEPGCVELRFLLNGVWAPAVEFRVAADASGEMIPLDRRLRELVEAQHPPKVTVRERAEHLALLARWYYSSWRDGQWIAFDGPATLPYRKLVRAVSKVASAQEKLFG